MELLASIKIAGADPRTSVYVVHTFPDLDLTFMHPQIENLA